MRFDGYQRWVNLQVSLAAGDMVVFVGAIVALWSASAARCSSLDAGPSSVYGSPAGRTVVALAGLDQRASARERVRRRLDGRPRPGRRRAGDERAKADIEAGLDDRDTDESAGGSRAKRRVARDVDAGDDRHAVRQRDPVRHRGGAARDGRVRRPVGLRPRAGDGDRTGEAAASDPSSGRERPSNRGCTDRTGPVSDRLVVTGASRRPTSRRSRHAPRLLGRVGFNLLCSRRSC